MGTFNGSAQGGRFSSQKSSARRRSAPTWKQIVFSLLLLLDLFMIYTVIMQLTHTQMAFEVSKGVNLFLLAVFLLGALALCWLILRTNAWKRLLCLFLICCICYLTIAFSELSLFKNLRDTWLKTALATMRHQGLATFYFPPSSVDAILREREEAMKQQEKVRSTDPVSSSENATDETEWAIPDPSWSKDDALAGMTPEQKQFYTMFYELDVASAEAYFKAHSDVLKDGYMNILVNEASLDSDGTSIRSKLDEKVLAIDAANEILILEVDCDGARGVLAIAKDHKRLHLYPSSNLPYYGETVGAIANRNDGILAMTGSGFDDPEGAGSGGQVAGYAMCDGTSYNGVPFRWGYKRLELRRNGWFYLTDTYDPVDPDTTDAMEFSPAMVVNGEAVDIGYWTDNNPRACIGQSKRGEILMLCVEGRGAGGSWGCSLSYCRDVFMQHDCQTAMNCDGGTTAIMWYRGEPIMRCSNPAIPQGRYLPNAWVYGGE